MKRSRFVSRTAKFDERGPSRGHLAALGAGLLLASGCYNYVPTEVGAVPPGEDVRVQVTRAGAEEFARITASNELRVEVRGEYEGLQNGTLFLRIPVVRDPTGLRPPIQQVVRLPEAEVLAVDRRQLSVGKTAALVGVGVGAVGFLITQVFEVFSDSGRDPDDGDLSLIPLFNLLFRGR